MAKQCAFCGQKLPRDDARFCNNCGQVQPAQATESVPSSSVPGPTLPPVNGWPPLPPRPRQADVQGMPSGTSRITRASLREQIAQQPPIRVPKRPVRHDLLESMGQLEAGLAAAHAPERSGRLAPIPLTPSQRNSAVELDLLTIKEPVHEEGSAREARQGDEHAMEPQGGEAQLSVEQNGCSTELPGQELHAHRWEEGQASAQQANGSGAGDPVLGRARAEAPVSEEGVRNMADAEKMQELGSEEAEAGKSQVEDLPTTPLTVPEPSRPIVQHPVTPLPETSGTDLQSSEYEMEELPTRPLIASPATPLPQQHASAPSREHEDGFEQVETRPLITSREDGFEQVETRPLITSRQVEPTSEPGETARPLSVRQIASQRKHAMPSTSPSPASPDAPEVGVVQRQVVQRSLTPVVSPASGKTAQPAVPLEPTSRQINHISAPLAPPMPQVSGMQTPRSEPVMSLGRKKHKAGLWAAFLLLFLLIAGGLSAWIIFDQPFAVSPVTQPDQAYTNTALGFSLRYPQGWSARLNASHATVSFFDNDVTDEFNVISTASNGQTPGQYINKEVAQLGMTGQKPGASLSFAGTSWQAIQGNVVQTGASYTALLLVTQRGDRFYTITQLAPAPTYNDEERVVFSSIRSSFRFL